MWRRPKSLSAAPRKLNPLAALSNTLNDPLCFPKSANLKKQASLRRRPRCLILGARVLGGLEALLGDEIDRAGFDLREHLGDVLAYDAHHEQLHAVEYHQADDHGRIAGDGLSVDEGFDQDIHSKDQRENEEQEPEQAREPQRHTRERG